MTLNITVVNRNTIHQSADFRLSSFDLGPDGTCIPAEDNSPKIVTLSYKEWAGFLSYTGIGKWDGTPTYKTAAEWIVALGQQPTFEDVVRVLETSGSAWIIQIQNRTRRFQSHTFILGAYERGNPRIAIISNTHSTKGSIPKSMHGGLQASVATVEAAAAGTHVYVTGLHSSVLKGERNRLKRMVDNNLPTNVIRHYLARVNANASNRKEANKGVSAACMCYSMDPLGGGQGDVYGQVTGHFEPVQIMNGINFSDALKQLGLSGPNVQLKGVAFATSASSNAVAAESIECTLDFAPEAACKGVVGRDIGNPNEMNIEIAAANEGGAIVGQLRRPVSNSPRAFLWRPGQEIVDLGTLGGPTSGASDVNTANMVVGSSSTQGNLSRAFLWRDGGPMHDLGVVEGNNSVATAINDLGVVVGHVYKSPSTPQMDFHRVFRWTDTEGMKLIIDTVTRWSEARDINNRGQILGWCHGSHQMSSFVWSDTDGLRLIEGKPGNPFYASSINDSGAVVGEADDEHGVRRAMIWTPDSGLRLLPVPFSFHPMAINNAGDVVGHDSNRPWSAAWLLCRNGELGKV